MYSNHSNQFKRSKHVGRRSKKKSPNALKGWGPLGHSDKTASSKDRWCTFQRVIPVWELCGKSCLTRNYMARIRCVKRQLCHAKFLMSILFTPEALIGTALPQTWKHLRPVNSVHRRSHSSVVCCLNSLTAPNSVSQQHASFARLFPGSSYGSLWWFHHHKGSHKPPVGWRYITGYWYKFSGFCNLAQKKSILRCAKNINQPAAKLQSGFWLCKITQRLRAMGFLPAAFQAVEEYSAVISNRFPNLTRWAKALLRRIRP